MSDDLIERLRALPWHEPAIAEAADEIERLTAALGGCCTCNQYGPMTVCPACTAIDKGDT